MDGRLSGVGGFLSVSGGRVLGFEEVEDWREDDGKMVHASLLQTVAVSGKRGVLITPACIPQLPRQSQ